MDTFAVIGGDRRAIGLTEALAGSGFPVIAAGFAYAELPACVTGCTQISQAVAAADHILLPLPVSRDEETLYQPFARDTKTLESLFSLIREGQTVFGGLVSPAVAAIAGNAGVTVLDYFAEEELAVRNAVPTAEGAIQIAMEELPITLADSRCLVTGGGRVARELVPRLIALHAQVTVAARRPEHRAYAQNAGCAVCDLSRMCDSDYDVIFNTVPAMLFPDTVLAAIRPQTLLIELASEPGGIDRKAAARRGFRLIVAGGLPGRVAPQTAGRIIGDTVLSMLRKRGHTV
ncbi:MAG: dipicolinate synthase [Clostridia bacterium]|nr:dipicolinate synthase [Clostridia bacterium]